MPDLAFNELKFLQRPNEHQDAVVQPDDQRKAKKDDRRRPQDEEISTYFAAQRRRGGEHDDARLRPVDHVPEQDAQAEAARRRRASRTPREVVELPEKPFLGFGSRGVQPDSRETLSDATTIISWSESIPRRRTGDETGECDELSRAEPRRSAKSNRHRPLKRHATDLEDSQDRFARAKGDVGNPEHGQWLQSRRGRGSTFVELYKPPAPSRGAHKRMNTSPTRTTSQSLPRHPAIGLEQPQQGKTADIHYDNEDYNAHRTSDILRVPAPYQQDIQAPTRESQTRHDGLHSDKENEDPSSPLSLDKMLSRLRDTVMRPPTDKQPATIQSSTHARGAISYQPNGPDKRREQQRRQASILHQMQLQQQDTDAEREDFHHHELTRARQDARAETPRWHSLPEKGFALAQDRSRAPQEHSIPSEHYKVPVSVSHCSPVLFRRSARMDGSDLQVEHLVPRSRSSLRPGLFEAQTSHPEDKQMMQSEELPLELSEPTIHESLIEQSYHSGKNIVRQEDQGGDDGPVGFWKPHQLY